MGMGMEHILISPFFHTICVLCFLSPVSFLCPLILFCFFFSFSFLICFHIFLSCLVLSLLILINLLFSCSPWESPELSRLYTSIFKRLYSRSAAVTLLWVTIFCWGMAWKPTVTLLIKFYIYGIYWVITNNKMTDKYLSFCYLLLISSRIGFKACKCIIFKIQR